jgi:hypothetical protein
MTLLGPGMAVLGPGMAVFKTAERVYPSPRRFLLLTNIKPNTIPVTAI